MDKFKKKSMLYSFGSIVVSFALMVAMLSLALVMGIMTSMNTITHTSESEVTPIETQMNDGSSATGGMIESPYEDDVSMYSLDYGPITCSPVEGGTWQYGFWNVKVRSYYTVDKAHGSTVVLNGKQSRSIDTAANRTSIAELWAIRNPSAVDKYYYRIVSKEDLQ